MLRSSEYLFITPGAWCSLIVLVIALIGSKFLPTSWGQENSPIEWLQVVILEFAVLAAILASYYGVGPLHRRRLFLWSVPIWLLAIGRELSWGRVFYVNSAGEFARLSDLWYGPYIKPLIIIISIITIWGLLKQGLPAEIKTWLKFGTVPILEILILFTTGIIATEVEHYSLGIFGPNEELYEELAELVCYSALLFLIIDLGFNKKIQPAKQPLLARQITHLQ
ncbi:MAG: hypothetical protein H6Q73_3822 [Firmicutes bacterium]|nr:hypothetical protein [Bacillota bacterium]